MKKAFIFGLILLAILLTGCLPSGKKESPEAEIGKEAASGEQEEGYAGSLEKMMDLGLPLKCSWKQDDDYYGESWVKGQKSYAEIHQEGKVAKIISEDDCIWAWEEGNSQGTKMCTQASREEGEAVPEETEEPKGQQPAFEYQQPKVEYQCQPAVFGDDKFDLPADINFMDINQMMQGLDQ
jgi:hypothetical protein